LNSDDEIMHQKAKEELKQTLEYQPALLSFESQREYRQFEDGIRDYISPRDILEQMTSEIVHTEWETVRLRGYKGQIVNLAKQAALRNLLHLICADADEDQIDDLARRWFTNKDVRKRIETLLRSHDFEESVINVEAYRLSMADLAEIDRRLSYLAVRRDKLFCQIQDYRAGIASRPARSHSDRERQIEHAGDA
jgi:hypothetical protein